MAQAANQLQQIQKKQTQKLGPPHGVGPLTPLPPPPLPPLSPLSCPIRLPPSPSPRALSPPITTRSQPTKAQLTMPAALQQARLNTSPPKAGLGPQPPFGLGQFTVRITLKSLNFTKFNCFLLDRCSRQDLKFLPRSLLTWKSWNNLPKCSSRRESN